MNVPLRIVEFKTATARIYEKSIETTFKKDQSISHFYPPTHEKEYERIAHSMGYGNALQYGIEHDLTHHFLADELGLLHSYSVWSAAHGTYTPGQKWSQRVADEEHLVNRFQRYMNTGEVDEDFGVLKTTFGDKLPIIALSAMLMFRPWLRV